jgi:hypothetical protein
MPSFYVYLLSSLPMLHFGAKPPFSYDRFMELCRAQVPEADALLLEAVDRGDLGSFLMQPNLRRWVDFDTTLRNELARGRATRLHVEAAAYLREEANIDLSAVHAAQAALRQPSPLDGERMLDEMRWHFLEEAAVGHHFDLDRLVVYALELKILLRWERISGADKARQLDEATTRT